MRAARCRPGSDTAPVFPSSGATAWAIPLYEPLTGMGPKVIATVCGAASGGKPRRCDDALLYVDSGSSHSALPAATLARLGVETTGSRFATIQDAAGERRAWSGGLVPEVRLGDVLSLTNVVTAVHDQTAILGGDVLTAHGWRVDLDRGTLVLGAPPPSAGAARVRLPVRGFHGGSIADLSVQGRTVPLLLDTGAPITVVDVSWLKALGAAAATLSTIPGRSARATAAWFSARRPGPICASARWSSASARWSATRARPRVPSAECSVSTCCQTTRSA